MAESIYQYELDALPRRGQHGGASEAETEHFFGRLFQLAARGLASPGFGRVGLAAARGALSGGSHPFDILPKAPAGFDRHEKCNSLSRKSCNNLVSCGVGGYCNWNPKTKKCLCMGSLRESESEARPVSKVCSEVIMEQLGHIATRTPIEAEAQALVGAMVPLAARAVPRAAPALLAATPALASGLAGVVRALRRSPATRPLVRTVPSIMRRTAASIARQSAAGVSVTPQRAVKTLALQTQRVVSNPRQSVQAYRRSKALAKGRCGCTSCSGEGTGEAEFLGLCWPAPGCAKMTDPDTGLTTCVNLGGCSGTCSLSSLGWCCCN
jgi:hypothetical protein